MQIRASRYSEIDTNFADFAESRSASFFVQFWEIFVRNLKYLTRNRKAFFAIVANSLIISLMVLSVFWKIGTFPDLYKYVTPFPTEQGIADLQTAYQQYLENLTGLSFMISNQLSISASINVIM